MRRSRDRDNQQVVQGEWSWSNAEPGTSLWRVAAWPKPHSASQHGSSAARVQPGERTMRSVMGRVGIIITRCRDSPPGCW